MKTKFYFLLFLISSVLEAKEYLMYASLRGAVYSVCLPSGFSGSAYVSADFGVSIKSISCDGVVVNPERLVRAVDSPNRVTDGGDGEYIYMVSGPVIMVRDLQNESLDMVFKVPGSVGEIRIEYAVKRPENGEMVHNVVILRDYNLINAKSKRPIQKQKIGYDRMALS